MVDCGLHRVGEMGNLRFAVLDTTSTTVAILTRPANRRCLEFQSAVFEKPRNSFVILRDPSQYELAFDGFISSAMDI